MESRALKNVPKFKYNRFMTINPETEMSYPSNKSDETQNLMTTGCIHALFVISEYDFNTQHYSLHKSIRNHISNKISYHQVTCR